MCSLKPYLIVQSFWYDQTDIGDFYYRIGQPGSTLSRHRAFSVRNLHVYHPEFARWSLEADLLIIHVGTDFEITPIITERRARGLPTIFEMPDNLLHLGTWIEENNPFRSPDHRRNLFYHASLCDALQFSTHELAKTFGFLNPNHVVFENQVTILGAVRPRGKPLMIGWGGSQGHEHDLAGVGPALTRFFAERSDVVFAFMGHQPIYDRHFCQIPENRRRYTPPGSIEDYQNFVRSLDIGLAPLSDTEFNRCRSDGKFMEYASFGVAPLLSNAAAYRATVRDGETAMLFASNEELIQKLGQLCDDPGLLEHLKQGAYDYVCAHRTTEVDLERRAQYYLNLLPKESRGLSVPEINQTGTFIPSIRKSFACLNEGRTAEAESLALQMLTQEPKFRFGQHIYTQALLAQERYQELLEGFDQLRKDPIYGDMFAITLLGAAREVDPSRVPQILDEMKSEVHRLLNLDEDAIEAETRFRKVLEINPYHYQAMVELGTILATRPETFEEAQSLMTRIMAMHPESQAYLTEEES